jgi:very-short-patch-repair endonuclease
LEEKRLEEKLYFELNVIAYDAQGTNVLESLRWMVFRFDNVQVLSDFEGVVSVIYAQIESRLTA